MMSVKCKNRLKKFLIIFVSIIIVNLVVILPVVTVLIYEGIFSMRYETDESCRFSLDDYEGLQCQRNDFLSEEVTLAGYMYFKENMQVKGVLVLVHGLGGGGHNTYMPFVDYFTSNGYYVFAYDATGNDNSGGKNVEGFPQGIIDLNNALCHVETIEEYQDLPVFLLGHSWGGYSVGNVLCMHPDVKGAVIIAGFNESENLLQYHSEKIVGDTFIDFLMLYVEAYEQIKFGKEYTDITAIQGMEATNANILIAHSKDDTSVPTKYGYDIFNEKFGDSERFHYVLYEDKGHSDLYYSNEAIEYRGKMGEHICLEKQKCYELDEMLMEEILKMFEKSL